jgi:hypothetical protein
MSRYQIRRCMEVAGLILLKCGTHIEKMVTIGMGKQVQNMGYDRNGTLLYPGTSRLSI